MSKAPKLRKEIIRRLLRYNRRTGVFTWRRRPGASAWNTRYAGKIAGFDWSPDGGKTLYRSIRIFDWPFLAHRLAVLYVTGRWPEADVDHEDRDGLNNRWKNLRDATKTQNGFNRGANKNSRTGIKGVSPYGDRFRAAIQGETIGIFDDAQSAASAYQTEARVRAGAFAGSP